MLSKCHSIKLCGFYLRERNTLGTDIIFKTVCSSDFNFWNCLLIVGNLGVEVIGYTNFLMRTKSSKCFNEDAIKQNHGKNHAED